MSDADRIRELEEALRQRDALIDELKRQVDKLKDDIDAWKRGHRIRQGGKISQKKKLAPTEKKQPGRKKGHAGSGRKGPDHIDRFEEVMPPPACPFCNGQLALADEAPGLHKVEELVPGHTEVVGYRRHVGRCMNCGKTTRAKLPNGLGQNPKLGLRAQALLVEAKTELGLTLGQLQKLARKQYGLRLSQGGIQQILHRAAEVLKPTLGELERHLAVSTVAWADETPMRIWGESGYLWMVMTKQAVLFCADRSRGKEVPMRMLAHFRGYLHSDFYGSYYAVKWVTHLGCWAHLTREARQLAEREQKGKRAQRFSEQLSGIYEEAAKAQEKPEQAETEVVRLKGELWKLARDEELGRHAGVRRLQGRLIRRCEELLRFVLDPRLESTNNRSERELRLFAMMRHVSGGARSDKGARTFATLFSVVRTAARQEQALFEFFVEARRAFHGQAQFPSLNLPALPAQIPLN